MQGAEDDQVILPGVGGTAGACGGNVKLVSPCWIAGTRPKWPRAAQRRHPAGAGVAAVRPVEGDIRCRAAIAASVSSQFAAKRPFTLSLRQYGLVVGSLNALQT